MYDIVIAILPPVIIWCIWFFIARYKKSKSQMIISTNTCLICLAFRLFGIIGLLSSAVVLGLVTYFSTKDTDIWKKKVSGNGSAQQTENPVSKQPTEKNAVPVQFPSGGSSASSPLISNALPHLTDEQKVERIPFLFDTYYDAVGDTMENIASFSSTLNDLRFEVIPFLMALTNIVLEYTQKELPLYPSFHGHVHLKYSKEYPEKFHIDANNDSTVYQRIRLYESIYHGPPSGIPPKGYCLGSPDPSEFDNAKPLYKVFVCFGDILLYPELDQSTYGSTLDRTLSFLEVDSFYKVFVDKIVPLLNQYCVDLRFLLNA